MALVDELSIHARAGDGGDGVTRWLHLKGREYSGPAGGNGGNGGDIYIRAVRDISLLGRYRGAKAFEAEDGGDGESYNRDGRGGKDLTIDLPIGSVVHNRATGEVHELMQEEQRQLILKGGRGGAGNAVFKSSVNTTPQESMPGARGEEAEFDIELKLIADAGLIGLPNAGKSSLLNALTGASAKVGSYAFTTLDPNLGVLYGYVLADIPGLIEGASEGKGLGSKFLRHVSRTKMLLHCVSLEAENPLQDYETVRAEIAAYGEGLDQKPELVILTKTDMKTPAEVAAAAAEFAKAGVAVTGATILEDSSIKALGEAIVAKLKTE